MRKFSIRPTLTLKGRTFKGLRGWSGKPLHPPLTDFPIVAYVLGGRVRRDLGDRWRGPRLGAATSGTPARSRSSPARRCRCSPR